MNIQSASNNQLKSWKKLQMGKYRKKTGLFLAEGVRCVEQILDNEKVEVQELIIENGWNPNQLSVKTDLPIFELETSDFETVSDTDNPQGIVAVCKIPQESSVENLSQKSGVILATDAIQDPGNLGTIIRTACWFDVAGILIGTGTVDPFHPKVVRSTAGATGVLPYTSGKLNDLLSALEKENWTTFLLDAGEVSNNLDERPKSQKSILVVGNEGNGISNELFQNGRHRIKIDGNPNQVESLNAAVACSISLYEFSKG
ncbi:MAG: RNA methyltransferase [Balneolaceae bacterium]|nr:RNA methyltransferase [Balneolaceae bacterium]